jgi:branched-chain amino acid transport system substrate-binding protein
LTQTDFTAQCQNARNAGAEALRTAADGSTIARIARSCDALGFHPRLIGLSVSISTAQAADPSIRRDNYLVVSPTAPWTATDTPGQRDYLAALRQFAPDLIPDSNTTAAWTCGKLFEAAVERLGPSARTNDLTTATILDGLGRIKGETLNGLVPPITFTSGEAAAPPINCVYVEQLTTAGWTTPLGSRPLCF